MKEKELAQGKQTYADVPVYVGLDVHKQSWKVAVFTAHQEHKVFSQEPDAAQLKAYLDRHFPGGQYEAAYEAGFSGFSTARELAGQGMAVRVTHAADIPSTDKEKRFKTDGRDCRKLARGLRHGELKQVWVPPVELEVDRELLRYRETIRKDLTRQQCRIRSFLLRHSVRLPGELSRYWSGRLISHLRALSLAAALREVLDGLLDEYEHQRRRLTQATRRVRQLARRAEYVQLATLLEGIPGVGALGAMSWILEIGDMARFKTLDELCAYIGLVPTTHSSGERVREGRMTKRGKGLLKARLVESAWVAKRHDPALGAAFERQCQRMPATRAIVHVAKKLLARLRAVWLKQQPYEWNRS